MASYSINYTSTDITVTITGLVAGSSTYKVFVRLASDTSDKTIEQATTTASSSTVVEEFRGRLLPETNYVVNVNVNGSWLGSKSFTTKAEPVNVEPWSWSASTERTNFYNVLYGRLPAESEYFSHNVWNDLVNKVHELVVAKGSQWNQYYVSTPQSAYVSAGNSLSALKFNAVRLNLDLIQDTGISTVSVGDPILPSYFITLTNTINSAI